MDDVVKCKLGLLNADGKYLRAKIEDIVQTYAMDSTGKLTEFGGSCGLLRNGDYKGYCNLCATYHTMDTEHLWKPGYTVEFAPLYNKYGQMILVEYDKDDVFCMVSPGYKDYDGKKHKMLNAELTFFKHGAFTEFTEEFDL